MNNFGQRLKEALEKRNMSASELARRIGVTRGAVSFWLRGETQTVSGPNLMALATTLGIDATWLTTGQGNMDSSEVTMTSEELDLIKSLRQLSRQKQKVVFATTQTLINQLK